METGTPAPAMAEAGPALLPGLSFHLQAFEDLAASRPVGGFGPGAIPFEAIDRYARRFAIDDPDDFDDLIRFIRALDDEYLDWAAAESDRRSTS